MIKHHAYQTNFVSNIAINKSGTVISCGTTVMRVFKVVLGLIVIVGKTRIVSCTIIT